jgi:hypothetical protein
MRVLASLEEDPSGAKQYGKGTQALDLWDWSKSKVGRREGAKVDLSPRWRLDDKSPPAKHVLSPLQQHVVPTL